MQCHRSSSSLAVDGEFLSIAGSANESIDSALFSRSKDSHSLDMLAMIEPSLDRKSLSAEYTGSYVVSNALPIQFPDNTHGLILLSLGLEGDMH